MQSVTSLVADSVVVTFVSYILVLFHPLVTCTRSRKGEDCSANNTDASRHSKQVLTVLPRAKR